MAGLELVIGNYNYSSWSMRPFLLLKKLSVPFTIRRIFLYRPKTVADIRAASPSHKVPVLNTGSARVWDSLAICEYINDAYGSAWPEDKMERAYARSICAEMHSGFPCIRSLYPMSCRRCRSPKATPDFVNNDKLQAEVHRIVEIWEDLLRRPKRNEGPWLFGKFSIADAFYIPVVIRFRGYCVPVDSAACEVYMNTVLGDLVVQEWIEAGLSEPVTISEFER